MGYFSNGTEGMVYEEQYCARCVHQPKEETDGCPVWDLHHLWNGTTGDIGGILDMLIPRDRDGINQQCALFVQEAEDDHAD